MTRTTHFGEGALCDIDIVKRFPVVSGFRQLFFALTIGVPYFLFVKISLTSLPPFHLHAPFTSHILQMAHVVAIHLGQPGYRK